MLENWLDIILAILATYRITRAIVGEDGPFYVFKQSKMWIMKKFPGTHKGINCPLCISFWVSMMFTGLIGADSISNFFIIWLGIAGANVIIFRNLE